MHCFQLISRDNRWLSHAAEVSSGAGGKPTVERIRAKEIAVSAVRNGIAPSSLLDEMQNIDR